MSKVLFVHAKGGPPLGYTLSRIAAKAEVHLLLLAPLPENMEVRPDSLCSSVIYSTEREREDLVSLIVETALNVTAEAVITCSEYSLIAVAKACERIGIPGVGENCWLVRDKRMMRQIWEWHGIPQPRYAVIEPKEGMPIAAEHLSFPALLKTAWSSDSTAHQILTSPRDLAGALQRAKQAINEFAINDDTELRLPVTDVDFLVEEIVSGSAREWFSTPGWGDSVSVEGVVAEGVYYPVCLTGRMPAIHPFTEWATITPAPLTEENQQRIVALSAKAVNALGLRNCGTHTEIKLGNNGEMWAIETAARFGGAAIVPQAEIAFGVDLLGVFTDQLLGREVSWPSAAFGPNDARCGAGTLSVMAVDSQDQPWQDTHVWDLPAIVRSFSLSPGSSLVVVPEHSIPDGATMPPYDAGAGANAVAASCFYTSQTPEAVLRDFEIIVESLSAILPVRPEALPNG